jgi:hypothetical protein
MNGSKYYTEAIGVVILRDRASGRRALYVRYKPYRKERWWGLVVIMPE